jgi:hypothetical protein
VSGFSQLYSTPHGDDSWHRAVSKIWRSVKGEGPSLAAVQGPPGTGKTTIYVEIFKRIIEKADLFKKDIVVYIAPTNQLVLETFERFTRILFDQFKELDKVLAYITYNTRVYGSKVAAVRDEDISRLKDLNLLGYKDAILGLERVKWIAKVPEEDDLRKRGLPSGPMFIFTTEWQQISLQTPSERNIKILVDEASRSPLHRPFITLAREIAKRMAKRERVNIPLLSVIGDPEQAISLEDEYKVRKEHFLVMNAAVKLLRSLGLEDEAFEFLEYTKRLPHPSEEPISEGYYDGKLKSLKDAKNALKVFDPEGVKKACDKIRLAVPHGVLVDRVCNVVETIVSSRTPIGVVSTRSFPAGDTFEPERVRVASLLSAIFSLMLIYQGSEGNFTVSAVSPYLDLALGVQSYYVRRFVSSVDELRSRIAWMPGSTTVHSMLGGEADIIISILGKEWVGGSDPYSTIYFNEPELLNVQFSRQKRIMVIIGDVKLLRRSSAKFAQSLGIRLERGGLDSKQRRYIKEKIESVKKIRKTLDRMEHLVEEQGIPSTKLQ